MNLPKLKMLIMTAIFKPASVCFVIMTDRSSAGGLNSEGKIVNLKNLVILFPQLCFRLSTFFVDLLL